MREQKGVIIFIKNPSLGKVKTRLAKEVRDQEALNIYKALLTYTRQVSKEVRALRFLFYADYINEQDEWSNQKFIKGLQDQGDLGDRITEAFRITLEQCEKAVIIGSDCPQIKASHVEAAFEALNKKDVVIGPTIDGGYYLLGMKKLHLPLIEDIPWSSGQEFEVTLKRALKNHLTIEVLEALADVDYKEDWEKFGWPL